MTALSRSWRRLRAGWQGWLRGVGRFLPYVRNRERLALALACGLGYAAIGLLERLRGEFPGRVTVTGGLPHEQIPDVLRGIDVAVAPYPASEEFYFSPLKVLEYMAGGRAIVASRIGQLRQLIRDGETGLLVEPGSAPALAAAVRRLRADAGLRDRLARGARQEVERHHTWRARAAAILALVAADQRLEARVAP